MSVRGLAQGDRDEWQQPERVMADLHLQPGITIADVGCGSGYFTFRLAEAAGKGGRVLAVDIDKDALAVVRERAEAEGIGNVEVVRSEPDSTTLPSESIDAAFICDVLHEVPEEGRRPLVADVARTIRPGGLLYVIDYRKSHDVPFDPYDILVPRDELQRMAEEAGLVLDAEFHYLHYQVFLRFLKPTE
jgi:ubiquinone/menaquinone biosynthesis C-methylase UbiE